MGQSKDHKKCVQDVINRVKSTHLCKKEYPVFRDGNLHFLDVVGMPHPDKKEMKPIAVECECGSSNLQRASNMQDLIEFRRRYPDVEIFQVNGAREIDFNRLRKIQTPVNQNVNRSGFRLF